MEKVRSQSQPPERMPGPQVCGGLTSDRIPHVLTLFDDTSRALALCQHFTKHQTSLSNPLKHPLLLGTIIISIPDEKNQSLGNTNFSKVT